MSEQEERWQEAFAQGKLEAVEALLDIIDDKTLSEKTGVPIETIQSLRE